MRIQWGFLRGSFLWVFQSWGRKQQAARPFVSAEAEACAVVHAAAAVDALVAAAAAAVTANA